MIRNFISFLIFGFVWLFLFSIPVGHGRVLFDVGHYYFVDTKPVRWLIEKFNIGVKTSQSKASETVKETVDHVVDYMKQPLDSENSAKETENSNQDR